MKYIISRYNHDISWIKKYTNDFIIYDRSEKPVEGAIVVPNIGSDILDKFTYIIDNYDNLPDVAVYTKANLFKYITQDEFDKLQYNRFYTPLLTKKHRVYYPICGYDQDGMYCERNDFWYLNSHPAKYAKEIIEYFHMADRTYNAFAPGSNYILPRENILRTPLDTYKQLRSYLEWAVYPGDAQLIERNLHYLWR